MKSFLIIFLFLAFSFQIQAQDFTAVRQLAKRVVPWLEPHLVLKQANNTKHADFFEIITINGDVHITANNVNSAATGLNWYLQYYCHRSMSHMGDNLSPVSPLPKVKEEILITSPFQYRYALNYATLNYTMSFYSWKDWERELDWMALHGVNLMMAAVGT